MNIFVSSRIEELYYERKKTIEVLHFLGHTPLTFHIKPEHSDVDQTLKDLLRDSDALVILFYLSLGPKKKIKKNMGYVKAEYSYFRRVKPNSPILFLKKKVPESLPENFRSFIDEQKNQFKIDDDVNLKYGEFLTPDELTDCIISNIYNNKDWQKVEFEKKDIKQTVVRYTGPDFIGLIGVISEILFGNKMNIDYISHASRGGIATLYISCSPRAKSPVDHEFLKINLDNKLEIDLSNAAKEEDIRLVDSSNKTDFVLEVEEDNTTPIKWQFYIEIRMIDTPGQIFELCKVLRQKKFNIDNVHLTPTSPEYKRQTALALWVSNRNDANKQNDPRELLIELETAINNLSGTRVCSIRYHENSN